MKKIRKKIGPKLDNNNTTKFYDTGRDFLHMNKIAFNKAIGSETKAVDLPKEYWNKALKKISNVSKWKDLVSSRRKHDSNHRSTLPKPGGGLSKKKSHEQFFENLNSTLTGIASECEDSDCDEERTPSPVRRSKKGAVRDLSRSSNKALIIYLSKLARSKNLDDELDLDFIESLLNNGADINMPDRYGQTAFHEVARTWHCDVGRFLLEQNANINCTDKYGRTPLHVAAAVNYPDMVKFLIDNGADKEAKSFGEEQTPLHYAAKNDAVDSLKVLLKIGCDMEARDNKLRTPLQVAAELDRSETALFLVEQGATVGVLDSSGLSALTLMIEKMPPTAKVALDQFHVTDRPNRKQYFYLNLLEPIQPGTITQYAKTPMQTVIREKQMNLLLHPVFRRLLQVKWKSFGSQKHLFHLLSQFFFVLIWSVVSITTPFNSVSEYSQPFKIIWWRVVLESIAVLMTVFFIVQELYEWRCSLRDHNRWTRWRSLELQKDLAYCHPRWPEEQKYIMQELERIQLSRISYFADWWNIFDWIVYIWISVGVAVRIPALCGNTRASDVHREILALSMIVIWIRLLKAMRAFQALGPFIVMLGHILRDTLRFAFLYFEFFIPYIIAFWMLFGGKERAALMISRQQSADGWQHINDLIYSVWLITVVGEYDFNAIVSIDKLMAQILVGTFTALSGILLLNLFIALMSDTFQRVYDNAKANALMQMASSINTHQQNMGPKAIDQFRLFIQGNCAPEVLYYDDDDNEEEGELQKVTIQIKQVVDEIREEIEERLPPRQTSPQSPNQDGGQQQQQQLMVLLNKQATKFENELNKTNAKLDRLTELMTLMLGGRDKVSALLNKSGGTGRDDDTPSDTNRTLPSIFDLKPNLFHEKRLTTK